MPVKLTTMRKEQLSWEDPPDEDGDDRDEDDLCASDIPDAEENEIE